MNRREAAVRGLFEFAVMCGEVGMNPVPAPDLFLHAAARMGVEPHRCAVIEDSPFGLVAARDAGMSAFGFSGSVTPTHRLALQGVTIFESMAELPRLLTTAQSPTTEDTTCPMPGVRALPPTAGSSSTSPRSSAELL